MILVQKIERIRCDIESGRDVNSLPVELSVECGTRMPKFVLLGDTQVLDLIKGSKLIKSCALDPLPAHSCLRKCYTTLVPVLKGIIEQHLQLVRYLMS